jgi:hypothetical protein
VKKIDPAVALIMAMKRAIAHREAPPAWSGIYIPGDD